MTEPIKPATDEWIATTKERLGLLRGTSLDLVAGDSISRLIARIQSDEARIKALELERDTVQQYADRTGANLTAAEGTLAERDEQIARLKDEIASLRPRERLHEAESAVIRFVRAEMALSHYLDGDEAQEGVEADLAEEETEAMDAIRALGRRLTGVEPVEVPRA